MSVNHSTSTGESPTEPEPSVLASLTGFQRDLLFVVASLEGTVPTGVTVQEELADQRGDRVNHGRLYGNLRDLVDADLVEKRPVDGRTNTYRVTDTASEALRAHCQWEALCLGRECVEGEDEEDDAADDEDDGPTYSRRWDY
ncbi:helix-turn-helix transcriptional regulator [Halomarina oriensis]|uniref:DNA-binding protein n=1 Tax=Halomarina oriensis TaxID=671145 RepID=A0A6B0GN78_9EURY|nr:MarR family transcriptional regulator [Halomarina oriensis]MWG33028.1 DNA-binding protein [Halomarina oriensis]